MVEFTVFKGSKEGKIVKSTTKRELGDDEVLVKNTFSGVCGTDVSSYQVQHISHTLWEYMTLLYTQGLATVSGGSERKTNCAVNTANGRVGALQAR
jgi:hypothetical protein